MRSNHNDHNKHGELVRFTWLLARFLIRRTIDLIVLVATISLVVGAVWVTFIGLEHIGVQPIVSSIASEIVALFTACIVFVVLIVFRPFEHIDEWL